MDTREINVAMTETQFDQFGILDLGFWTPDFINPPTLFVFLRFSGVEHHAVTGFQRTFEPDKNALAQHACHFTEEHAAFFPKTRMDELLVVGTAQPTGMQTATESHLHVVAVEI